MVDILKMAEQRLGSIDIGEGTLVNLPQGEASNLKGRSVIVVGTPSKTSALSVLKGALRKIYKTIFELYEWEGSNLLSIPCFGGAGGGKIEAEVSAEIAIESALLFLGTVENAEIEFVCDRGESGQRNKKNYQEAVERALSSEKFKRDRKHLERRLRVVVTDITLSKGVIVLPLRKGCSMNKLDPIARAIINAAAEKEKSA